MKIKQIRIKNFGKFQGKTLTFSPGINVLYGKNESGKTTVHQFIKAMFYGMQRLRGKAAKTDAYSTYEPWENPVVYGGSLWFESENRNFRLTRNFYKTREMNEFLCEDDGELLDVQQGDLTKVLKGVSEAVYENTVSIAQMKNVTGPELVKELQNYMAGYQKSGDCSVDLGRAMQMLKMSRKGYQVQEERRKKEAEKEQEKLRANMEYIRQERSELEEKKSSLASREAALRASGGEDGTAFLKQRIRSMEKKQNKIGTVLLMMLLFTALSVILFGFFLDFTGLSIGSAVLGILLMLLMYQYYKKLEQEIQKRKRLKERWTQKQEKLQWSRENLEESCREKEIAYKNLTEEYQEQEWNASLPSAEVLEIQALNMAMETIEKLSGNMHSQVGQKLRGRVSEILSEITDGRYREILIDQDFGIAVNTRERTILAERLSRGTIEQIYFALRMAAGELLCGEEVFPIILDEIFGMYDDERLFAALRWLYREQRQVIISTCHKREMEIMDKHGIPYQKIML